MKHCDAEREKSGHYFKSTSREEINMPIVAYLQMAIQGDIATATAARGNSPHIYMHKHFWHFIHADYECNDVIADIGQSQASSIQKR